MGVPDQNSLGGAEVTCPDFTPLSDKELPRFIPPVSGPLVFFAHNSPNFQLPTFFWETVAQILSPSQTAVAQILPPVAEENIFAQISGGLQPPCPPSGTPMGGLTYLVRRPQIVIFKSLIF